MQNDDLWNCCQQENRRFKGNRSMCVAVVGAQWGDEGKGKLVDMFAAHTDLSARYNGGANAGHTVVIEGKKYAMHLLPCSIMHPHTQNLLGPGVVIDLEVLMQEIETFQKSMPDTLSRLLLCKRAHLVFKVHKVADGLYEEGAKEKAIGTTRRGIGPAYSSSCLRLGVRVGDCLDPPIFREKYMRLYHEMSERFGEAFKVDAEEEIQTTLKYIQYLRNQIVDSVQVMHNAFKTGQRILIEGANATMLDKNFGTYPFVTSSSTITGGVGSGLGIPPHAINSTIGVVKAYSTRVGLGPFSTELFDSVGQHMQKVGVEFGTTTGRARRCGWLDVPMLLYSCAINGFNGLFLTKIDVLTGIHPLRICTKYKNRRTGEERPSPSYMATAKEFEEDEPQFEDLDGWNEDLCDIRQFEQLPGNAQAYIRRVETLLETPILWVGVGPDRSQIIFVPSK